MLISEARCKVWNGKTMTQPISIRSDRFKWLKSSDILLRPTGLKDKNGVEIYEGDIVDYIDEGSLMIDGVYEVEYCKGKFYPVCELYYQNWPKTWGAEYTCEVIGNIWENPELLKEVKESK